MQLKNHVIWFNKSQEKLQPILAKSFDKKGWQLNVLHRAYINFATFNAG